MEILSIVSHTLERLYSTNDDSLLTLNDMGHPPAVMLSERGMRRCEDGSYRREMKFFHSIPTLQRKKKLQITTYDPIC